ncbi:endolytic transglycosylase MltG [Vulgatibacter sp.]|uniref:endolytic transglycosylase MltG n=1 Tax=Vulgatibacter sp. TaxID=1971226 RepID=UPI0035619973
MKKFFLALVALILLGGLGAGGAFVWAGKAVQTPLRPGAEPVEFTVPKGATGQALGAQLAEAGLITDARLWRFHLWRRGGLAAKAGRFSLSPGMSAAEIARALEGAPLADDKPFVIVEGWRLRDTDAALAAAGWIEPGAYIAAASSGKGYTAPFELPKGSLEGYLYPETYALAPEGFDVRWLVQRQLDTFTRRFWEAHRDEVKKSGRSLHDVVVMASLLEREEPLPAQRPLVAGILWKRIDANVPLGVDATSRYELREWNDRKAFLKRLRDPQDPWNTRTRAGLPPGPIGSPTVDSLQAALRPKKSEFWYYLHDANRILRPSRNAAEHEALRRKYNVY